MRAGCFPLPSCHSGVSDSQEPSFVSTIKHYCRCYKKITFNKYVHSASSSAAAPHWATMGSSTTPALSSRTGAELLLAPPRLSSSLQGWGHAGQGGAPRPSLLQDADIRAPGPAHHLLRPQPLSPELLHTPWLVTAGTGPMPELPVFTCGQSSADWGLRDSPLRQHPKVSNKGVKPKPYPSPRCTALRLLQSGRCHQPSAGAAGPPHPRYSRVTTAVCREPQLTAATAGSSGRSSRAGKAWMEMKAGPGGSSGSGGSSGPAHSTAQPHR